MPFWNRRQQTQSSLVVHDLLSSILRIGLLVYVSTALHMCNTLCNTKIICTPWAQYIYITRTASSAHYTRRQYGLWAAQKRPGRMMMSRIRFVLCTQGIDHNDTYLNSTHGYEMNRIFFSFVFVFRRIFVTDVSEVVFYTNTHNCTSYMII